MSADWKVRFTPEPPGPKAGSRPSADCTASARPAARGARGRSSARTGPRSRQVPVRADSTPPPPPHRGAGLRPRLPDRGAPLARTPDCGARRVLARNAAPVARGPGRVQRSRRPPPRVHRAAARTRVRLPPRDANTRRPRGSPARERAGNPPGEERALRPAQNPLNLPSGTDRGGPASPSARRETCGNFPGSSPKRFRGLGLRACPRGRPARANRLLARVFKARSTVAQGGTAETRLAGGPGSEPRPHSPASRRAETGRAFRCASAEISLPPGCQPAFGAGTHPAAPNRGSRAAPTLPRPCCAEAPARAGTASAAGPGNAHRVVELPQSSQFSCMVRL